jgi:peptidoglycan hydrolase-like protein with peptidoglycan-binding domain
MPKRITKSVGKGGVNVANDVIVVQTLLNRVGPDDGGPAATLQVDGRCGPKTNEAIKKFQLRQFVQAFADGRVDPNGRTLARLNDFDTEIEVPPLTTLSRLQCPHGGMVTCTPGGPPEGPLTGGIQLRTTDLGAVAGCSFPSPCVRVKWLPAITLTLDADSVGLCLNAAGNPQGPVRVVMV